MLLVVVVTLAGNIINSGDTGCTVVALLAGGACTHSYKQPVCPC